MPLGLLFVVAGLLLFGLLAVTLGVDTRDGRDWDRHQRI
jgi:hypothetical protein